MLPTHRGLLSGVLSGTLLALTVVAAPVPSAPVPLAPGPLSAGRLAEPSKWSVATESLPTPWNIRYGKRDRFVAIESGRIALGLREGAVPPVGTTPSPFPGIRFCTADLGADGEGWAAQASAWDADPSIAWVSPVGVDGRGGPLVFPREVVVGFDAAVSTPSAQRALLAGRGLTVLSVDWAGLPGVYRCRSDSPDARTTLSALQSLSARGDVLFAEPDAWFTGQRHGGGRGASAGSAVFNDPLLSSSWGLANFGQPVGGNPGGIPGLDTEASVAWPLGRGGADAPIAIFDVGVDLAHPDLNFTLPGTDVSSDPMSPGDGSAVNVFDSHGTAVAGCALAQLCNMIGSSGLAPDAAAVSIRLFITLDVTGVWASQLSSTVLALAYAESLGVRVTNNSNGYGFTSTSIDMKYAQTRDDGMVHVASTGNLGATVVDYPSSLPSVLAVSGIDASGSIAVFGGGASSTGPSVVLCGPAKGVVTTDRSGADGFVNGDYVFVDGTSFAAPFVAATAAMALQIEPDLSAAEVEALLFGKALDLGAPGRDSQFGFGLVRAGQVLAEVRSPQFDGTGDPIVLAVANSPDLPVAGPGAWVHRATSLDTVLIELSDPAGQFTGDAFVIGFEFVGGSPVSQVLPGFWLGPTAVLAPVAGTLPLGGYTLSLPVPPLMVDLDLVVQGVVLIGAGGLRLATTPGLDLRIR